MNAQTIVAALLAGAEPGTARRLLEASVRLPPRGHRWIAVYTGVQPGTQVWRSTGLTDRDAALARARELEAQARRQRAALGLGPRKSNIRVQRGVAGHSGTVTPGVDPLTQRETAMILRISERAVRSIERRALEKLRRHPKLRGFWAEFDSGDRIEPDLAEHRDTDLTPGEIDALFGLARTEAEEQALAKLLAWIGSMEK